MHVPPFFSTGSLYLFLSAFTNGECSQYRVYRCFQDSVSGINGSTAIDATDAGPPMERVLIKNYKQSDFTYMGIKYMNAPDSDDPGLKVEVAMITLDGEPEECTPTAAAQNPNLVWLRRACLDPAQFGNFTLHPSFGGGNVILCCRHDSMDAKHPHQLVLAPVDSIPDKMTLYFTWPTS